MPLQPSSARITLAGRPEDTVLALGGGWELASCGEGKLLRGWVPNLSLQILPQPSPAQANLLSIEVMKC